MTPVSIILTTYQGETRGFLPQAIESVLQQTYPHWELLIIDDGSTDKTCEICQKYLNDPRVKYHFQPNKGLAGARNTGIQLSRHPYICLLDDDDLYEPEKLEKQVKMLSEHPDPRIGMIYSMLTCIDTNGQLLGLGGIPSDGDIYEKIIHQNIVGAPSSAMIKREVFEKVGLFKEYFRLVEDYEFWIRVAKHYHIYSDRECLLRYRIHATNASKQLHRMHFYEHFALASAFQDAPQELKLKKMQSLHRLHFSYAMQAFHEGIYPLFQMHYLTARLYGTPSWIWRVRYGLSYFPALFNTLRSLKRSLKI
jgi:glycosyltransferase involved in cell wall biosynthesis